MKFLVGTKNPAKLKAVEDALIESPYFSADFEIEGYAVESGVSDQPKSLKETLDGAKGRIHELQNMGIKADFYIGLEGGVTQLDDSALLFCLSAISNGEKIHFANGSMIPLPQNINKEIYENDADLGDLMRELTKDEHVTHKGGTYGELTEGMITRDIGFKQAIHCSFAPFFNKYYK